ncbi:nitroreductase [Noviherbaspirillum pedocola]|uniref:Nitroreductase n=1 Tax=Noviherbaspirillum pedocola TaxID=2801341 RepID=A0A934W8J7_9BURK|nr:nitroreductase [Noviherbaspirillum pedocola]MBK4738717.1 nitroreductase [Noviherbaspirillum pedocola]
MDVYEAIRSRRSVRGFLNTPVPVGVMPRILAAAARAPSGGNLQPWHIKVISGAAMQRLKAIMQHRVEDAPQGEAIEYDIYPKELVAPYRDRRFQIGEDLYAQLAIPREDKAARRKWFARNYQFFGAPVGLFCTVDRRMGPPQWSDLGMFLQNVMLLLRAEGLDSCPQECWATYPQTIAEFLGTPAEQMLFTGMAIGYADPEAPANRVVAKRAELGEFAQFIEQ